MIHLALLQVTTPLLNGTISNSTSLSALLSNLNNSPAYNGELGLGISLAVFGTSFAILTFRIKVMQALLVASYLGLIITLILSTPPLNIESTNVVVLMIALAIVSTIGIVFDHILHPFD